MHSEQSRCLEKIAANSAPLTAVRRLSRHFVVLGTSTRRLGPRAIAAINLDRIAVMHFENFTF